MSIGERPLDAPTHLADTAPVAVAPADERRPGLTDDLRAAPTTVYALIAVLLLVAWLPASAAFEPAIFCAGGLAILVLTVVALQYGVAATTFPLPRRVALAAAAAFALWTFASIAWAADRGAAFDGATRTAVTVLAFVLFAIVAWTPRTIFLATGLFGSGTVIVAAVAFAGTARSAHPDHDFISGRWSPPSGYENASAALLLVAVLPLLVALTRVGVPVVFRAVLFAIAVLGIDLALLAESRGATLAAAIVVVLWLLVGPDRHRTVVTLLLVAGCVLIAAPAALDVYNASDRGFAAFETAVDRSAHAIVWSVAAAAVVGAGWGLLLPRLGRLRRVERRGDQAVLVLAVLALLVPVGAAIAKPHSTVSLAHRGWNSFAHSGSPTGTSRFNSLGSNRYDMYRVALDEARAHPVAGVGTDNFAADYLRNRRTDDEPLFPHSGVLRIPAQTGIVGSLLVLAFAGALAVAALRKWRLRRGTTIALILPIAYLCIHGAFDWLWEFAGIAAPVAAWAGVLVSFDGNRTPRLVKLAPLSRILLTVAGVAVAVPVAVGWWADHQTNTALSQWRSNPARAIAVLDDASSVNVFSDRASLLAAAIAQDAGAAPTAERELQRAAARNPGNWYTHLLLGAFAARHGSWANAADELRRAHALNPREPTIVTVMRDVRRHRVPNLQQVDEVFLARAAERVRSGVTR